MIEQTNASSGSPHPPETPRVLAMDLGATRLRAAAVSAAGQILVRHEARTLSDGSPRALVGSAIDLLGAVAADLPEGARAGLEGIGISAVGPLDPARGTLLGPPNLGDGYRGLELAGPLGRHFGLPASLERDTNVAALGERALGAARDRDDFMYVTVSTGVGGGVFAGGKLLGGAGGFAGELGHVPVGFDGPACGCGQAGHLEAYASGTGLARRGREAVAAGRSETLARRARRKAGGTIDAVDVAAAAEEGDAAAEQIVGEAVEAFALAALGFVNAFDPGLIVVGGGVAAGLGDRLLEGAREKVERFALAPPARCTRIVPAELGDDCGLIGCLPLVTGQAPAGAASRPGARMEA